MHTLMQLWVRKRLSSEKQVALVSKALSILATVVESARQDSKHSNICQALEKLLLLHIIACLSRVSDVKHCDVKWCVLGDVCKQQKRYGEAVTLYQKGLSDPDIAIKQSCSQRQYLRFQLGFIYQLQYKDNDAVDEYKAIITECDNDPPDEDNRHIWGQFILDIYMALSSILTRKGRMAESGRVLKEGIDKLQDLFGPNSFQVLQLLDLCAAEYCDRKHYTQAEILYKWILFTQIQTLGIDHPRTIHANEKLARVYFQQGRLPEAETISESCLPILEKSLGKNHLMTLQQVHFLGRISINRSLLQPRHHGLRNDPRSPSPGNPRCARGVGEML